MAHSASLALAVALALSPLLRSLLVTAELVPAFSR